MTTAAASAATETVNCGFVRMIGPTLGSEYIALTAGENGCLYALPCKAGGRVLEIEPRSGTMRELGEPLRNSPHVENGKPYVALAAAGNGRLYAPPMCATYVLEIDPAAETVQHIGPPLDGENHASYNTICLAANGKLYSPPAFSGQSLEIDPCAGHVLVFGDRIEGDAADDLYCTIVAAGNGHLYAPPFSALRVLDIDPLASTARAIGGDIEEDCNPRRRYANIAVAENGCLYAPPAHADKVLAIDPTTDVVRQIGPSLASFEWPFDEPRTFFRGTNGNLHTMNGHLGEPDTGQWLTIDPSSEAVTFHKFEEVMEFVRKSFATRQEDLVHYNSCGELAGNGLVYCLPEAPGYALEVDSIQCRAREVGPLLGCGYQVPIVACGQIFALPLEAGFPILTVTYKTLPTCHAISNALWSALSSGDLSDVVVRTTQGKSYRAHKVVLAVRSAVFRSMFRSQMREAEDGLVELGDVSDLVLDLFMQHIYCTDSSSGPIGIEDLCELSVLAHRYELDELVQNCTLLMGASLDTDNAASLLRLSDRLQLPELKQACLDFILANPQVTQTDEWEEVSPAVLREVTEAFSGIRRKRRRPSDWEFPTDSDWSKLALPQLRRACAERGLAQEGQRLSLVERLAT